MGRICCDDAITFGGSISHNDLVLHECKIVCLVTSIWYTPCKLYKMLYRTLFNVSYIKKEPKFHVHNHIYSEASA